MDGLDRDCHWDWFDFNPLTIGRYIALIFLRFPRPKIVILMTLTTSNAAQTRILFAPLPVC